MTYRKHTIIISFILLMCICLGGCMRDEENEQDAVEWREQAEELAVTYIEEKYGFTPEVLDSKSNNNDSVVPPSKYISQTIITLSYKDDTFIVVADGSDSTTENVLDNYQAEEIRKAFQDYLSEYFQTPVHDVYLETGRSATIPGKEFNMQYNFFHEYYDGTNLEELLAKYAITAYAKVVGDVDLEELSHISKDSLIFQAKTELLITTHDSEMQADKCSLRTYFDDTVYAHAMYISDAMSIRKGEITQYDLSVGQYGDIYYLIPGVEASDYSVYSDVDGVDMSEWEMTKYSYRETGEDAYYVSGSFTISSPKLYIYYPKDSLPDKPDGFTGYRMGIAYWDNQYDKYRYERLEGVETEEYLVYDMSLKNKEDISARLLFQKEQ